MLEESNETIFQMKDAMYFFFKELQLNMDNWLKSHVRSFLPITGQGSILTLRERHVGWFGISVQKYVDLT